ncbi:MAG: hypothetical protein CFE25_07290 [Chitinophagaceae bacterium BSSC1]|nr:MAG: hypothetical protein CFE25_07290 [Chitinophagaceae bacterium BSSC1]
MTTEINLRIVLQNPIEGTRYGLQMGKGHDYETVQGQLGSGHDLKFNFTIQIKEINESAPTITGPFVQGPKGNRFIYIGIGSYAEQTGALWNGRIKVPLPEAAFENIQTDEDQYLWSCNIPGRNKDGKPAFATVKPFEGWFRHK